MMPKLGKLLMTLLFVLSSWAVNANEIEVDTADEVERVDAIEQNEVELDDLGLEETETENDLDVESMEESDGLGDIDDLDIEITELETVDRNEIERDLEDQQQELLESLEEAVEFNTSMIGAGLTTAAVNLRETPNGKTIRRISTGTNITIDGVTLDRAWVLARVGNTQGWMNANSVIEANAFVITTTTTNLRNTSSVSGNTIRTLSSNQILTVIDRVESWRHVHVDGVSGWVQVNHVAAVGITAVTTGSANLRRGPGTSQERIRTVPIGTSVTILNQSVTRNWLRIRVGNQTGWISSNFVRTSSISAMVTVAEAAVREGPGTNHNRRFRLQRNRKITITGRSLNGNWSLVSNGTSIGWMRTTSLRQVRLPATVTIRSAAFRRGPGTGFARIRSLNRHTNVTVFGSTGNWTYIRVGNRRGWIRTTSIRLIGQPGRTSSSRTTPFRRGPGTNFSRIRTLPRHTRFTILARHGNWLYIQVRNGSTRGWISSNSGQRMTYSGRLNGVRELRRGPGTNFARIRTLSHHTHVTVLAYHGNWSRVRVGNQTGWIQFLNVR